MEIDKFIYEFKNVLPVQIIGSLVKYVSTQQFEPTEVLREHGSEIDKSVRHVETLPIGMCRTYTETHWHNLLCWAIKQNFKNYNRTMLCGTSSTQITSVEILKYEKDMFYKTHTDYNLKMPRAVSAILYLNNDYEGGTTSFFNPLNGEKIFEAKPEPGKLIMWPSNFMYPHSADPVTKGTRYVVVSWIG